MLKTSALAVRLIAPNPRSHVGPFRHGGRLSKTRQHAGLQDACNRLTDVAVRGRAGNPREVSSGGFGVTETRTSYQHSVGQKGHDPGFTLIRVGFERMAISGCYVT